MRLFVRVCGGINPEGLGGTLAAGTGRKVYRHVAEPRKIGQKGRRDSLSVPKGQEGGLMVDDRDDR